MYHNYTIVNTEYGYTLYDTHGYIAMFATINEIEEYVKENEYEYV